MFSKKLFNNNQNSSGGGTGGPTNWGSIGGDINNQTDLKNKLADKASKSELPVIATNNNVGLVKPDGTSITITNDGTISSVGGGGTDVNFIPAGTVVDVKLDGSGQFTKLSDAINYLTGKWSNGTVTIQLGEGTFEETEPITIDGNKFNFSNLVICGTNRDNSIISFNISGIVNYFEELVVEHKTNVLFKDISLSGKGRTLVSSGNIVLNNVCISSQGNICFYCLSGTSYLDGIILKDAQLGLAVTGRLNSNYQSNITLQSLITGIQVTRGGLIALNNLKKVVTNVTNLTNQSIGTANGNGFISGSWS